MTVHCAVCGTEYKRGSRNDFALGYAALNKVRFLCSPHCLLAYVERMV